MRPKSYRESYTLYQSTITLLCYLLSMVALRKMGLSFSSVLLFDLFFILQIIIFLSKRRKWRQKYMQKTSGNAQSLTRYEISVFANKVTLGVLLLHLIITLVYGFVNHTHLSLESPFLTFSFLLPMLLLLYITRFFYTLLLTSYLDQEEWVPLLNAQGKVCGRSPSPSGWKRETRSV